MAASDPTDLPKRSWKDTLKRTATEFKEDNLTDWAAALTYYAVLSIFPALIALLSIVGLLVSPQTITRVLTDTISAIGPASAVKTFQGPINSITANQSAAGLGLIIGLAGALWTASGYTGAFMRASNSIYEIEEGRPFWKLRPLQILVTLVLELMLAIVVVALVVSGPLAEAVGDAIGFGDAAVTVYSIAKWPILIGVVMMLFAALYYAAPNVKQPKFRWVSPGGVLAVLVWIVASVAFGFYVSNFGSYNKTYGTLGGVISFLVWMWITNIAILLGAEFDAELERERELEAGVNARDEIKLPPRDTKKVKTKS